MIVEIGNERLEVDFLWRRERLVVEVDAFSSHGTRYAFEVDRRRDRLLQVAGLHVIRVTPREMDRYEARLVADIRRLVASR